MRAGLRPMRMRPGSCHPQSEARPAQGLMKLPLTSRKIKWALHALIKRLPVPI
jgi:hypothetical protein